MSDTKKRPHPEDAEQSMSKKRAVGGDRSPSQANGVVPHPDEPKDGDNLEVHVRIYSSCLSI